jgi:hypothetical protein
LEYKPRPKKTTIVYEGVEKKMEIDFSLVYVLPFLLTTHQASNSPQSV